MAGETLAVVLSALGLGALGMHLLLKHTNIIRLISRDERKKHEIINNPDLLLEKLKANGEIVEQGEIIEPIMVEKDGERRVDFKRTKKKPDKVEPAKKGVVKKNPKKTTGKKPKGNKK